MSAPTNSKRHPTSAAGVYYRLGKDGKTRSYVIGFQDGPKWRWLTVRGNFEDAKAARGRIIDKLRGGETLPDRNARFGPLAEEWLASKAERRRSTRELYRLGLDSVVLPHFQHAKVAAITTTAIADLIRDLKGKGLSASTIENYLAPLNGTLAYAVSQRLIPANPYSLLTTDQGPRRAGNDAIEAEDEGQPYEWSDEEIASLLRASERLARQPESRYDYSPILRLAVRTGLRLGELLGLTWGNVDLEAGVIHVRQQWTKFGELTPPKTKRSRRRVPLAPEDVTYLRKLKLASSYSKEGDFLFTSRTGTPLGHRNVQRRGFEKARDEAELPKHLTFHSLRHAFASYAAHRGVPVRVVSEVMGHSNAGITERVYLHLFGREEAEDDFRKAMAGGGQ